MNVWAIIKNKNKKKIDEALGRETFWIEIWVKTLAPHSTPIPHILHYSAKWIDLYLQRTLQGLETWSMFPHILLDVKPQHRVLDMCAAPGYIASQVAEIMNSEPLQSQSMYLYQCFVFVLPIVRWTCKWHQKLCTFEGILVVLHLKMPVFIGRLI